MAKEERYHATGVRVMGYSSDGCRTRTQARRVRRGRDACCVTTRIVGGMMAEGEFTGRRRRRPDSDRLIAMIDALADNVVQRQLVQGPPSWRKLGGLINEGNPTILLPIRSKRRVQPSSETLDALARLAGDNPAIWQQVGGRAAPQAPQAPTLSVREGRSSSANKAAERMANMTEQYNASQPDLDLAFDLAETVLRAGCERRAARAHPPVPDDDASEA